MNISILRNGLIQLDVYKKTYTKTSYSDRMNISITFGKAKVKKSIELELIYTKKLLLIQPIDFFCMLYGTAYYSWFNFSTDVRLNNETAGEISLRAI